MKIIKMGKSEPKETKKKCGYCGTVFTYTAADVQPDSRDGDYVVCPNNSCKKFLAV